MFNQRDSYVPVRRLFYALIWVSAVVELGLTAARIQHTRSTFGVHDRIVVELLVTSILTTIWAPLALIFHRRRRAPGVGVGTPSATTTAVADPSRRFRLAPESAGTLVLWLMWLVGAAIATHRWPNRLAVGYGRQASVLMAIVAFGLLEFGLLMIVQVLALMEYSEGVGAASAWRGDVWSSRTPEVAAAGAAAENDKNTRNAAAAPNFGAAPPATATGTITV